LQMTAVRMGSAAVGQVEAGAHMLPEEVNKSTLADWKESAASYVRQQLFDKKQFVTDNELAFGGTIQVLACSDINTSNGKRAQIFWDEKGGKETVRNTFRRKRQAAQNAMKIAFRGEWEAGGGQKSNTKTN
jgi:hypothetical protein